MVALTIGPFDKWGDKTQNESGQIKMKTSRYVAWCDVSGNTAPATPTPGYFGGGKSSQRKPIAGRPDTVCRANLVFPAYSKLQT